jgi:hypothetical protein
MLTASQYIVSRNCNSLAMYLIMLPTCTVVYGKLSEFHLEFCLILSTQLEEAVAAPAPMLWLPALLLLVLVLLLLLLLLFL